MQLIEVSEIGVRAAIVRLASPKVKPVWLMFPMMHLGERSYYEQVEAKMAECDLVLAEGIDSRIVGALTSSYRLATDRVHGLVVQPSEIEAGDHMVVQQSDISGDQFDAAWRSISATDGVTSRARGIGSPSLITQSDRTDPLIPHV